MISVWKIFIYSLNGNKYMITSLNLYVFIVRQKKSQKSEKKTVFTWDQPLNFFTHFIYKKKYH